MAFCRRPAATQQEEDTAERKYGGNYGHGPVPKIGNRPADTSRHESWSTNDFTSEPPGPKFLVSLVALVRGTKLRSLDSSVYAALYAVHRSVLRPKFDLSSLYTLAAVRSIAI